MSNYVGIISATAVMVEEAKIMARSTLESSRKEILLTTLRVKGRTLETEGGKSPSHPLISIPLGSRTHETAMMIAKNHVRRLPVTEKGKIVGIVTTRDWGEA